MKQTKSNNAVYYVYAYLRKDGTPYYIGKGKELRAFSKHNNKFPPKDKSRIVFLETNLTEIGAFAIERRMIRWYGRKDIGTGILRNLTDGGEGCSGIIPWNKGVPCTEDRRANIRSNTIGKKRNEVTKAKMSAERKNKPQTPNRITAINDQKNHTVYRWVNLDHGEIICSKWELLEKYKTLTKTGLGHVILGYQHSHRGWKIKPDYLFKR